MNASELTRDQRNVLRAVEVMVAKDAEQTAKSRAKSLALWLLFSTSTGLMVVLTPLIPARNMVMLWADRLLFLESAIGVLAMSSWLPIMLWICIQAGREGLADFTPPSWVIGLLVRPRLTRSLVFWLVMPRGAARAKWHGIYRYAMEARWCGRDDAPPHLPVDDESDGDE